MTKIMKYEFINDDTHQFYCLEANIGDEQPAPLRAGDRMIRKWKSTTESPYRVCKLKETESKYIRTLLTKGGNRKIKSGEYV